jgi:hypothetical protein
LPHSTQQKNHQLHEDLSRSSFDSSEKVGGLTTTALKLPQIIFSIK